jgi:hypothetical protein
MFREIRKNIESAKLSTDSYFLELPITMKFFKVPSIKSLYIRKDFIELYNIMSKRLSLPNTSDDYAENFVITGTPGIGKSSLLFYLLWKFFTGNSPEDAIWKDRKIFYQISSTHIYYLKSKDLIIKYDPMSITNVIDDLKKRQEYKPIFIEFIMEFPRGSINSFNTSSYKLKQYIDDINRLLTENNKYFKGIGIGGRSEDHPHSFGKFSDEILRVRSNIPSGILNPHAGEFGTTDRNLVETITSLPERIGHGIQIINFKSVL